MNNKLLKVIKDLILEGEKLKSQAGNLFGTKRSNMSDSEYISWLKQSVNSIKKLGESGKDLTKGIENDPDIQFSYEHNVENILGNLQAALKIAEEHSVKSQKNTKNKYYRKTKRNINKVFIIHGHNETAKQTVARFIEHLGLTPIILHEQPNRGRTLIEKVLDHTEDVNFAVALLTSDDIGYSRKSKIKKENRARQNVIFELGLFIGILGRQKVVAMCEKNVKSPSDYDGVVYIPFGNAEGWKLKLAKELKEVFKFIDLNNVR